MLYIFIFAFTASAAQSVSITKKSDNRAKGEVKRTGSHSVEYDNPDGTITRETGLRPFNYRGKDGSWKKIETEIKKSGSGFENRKNILKTRFGDGVKEREVSYEGETGSIKWLLKGVSFIGADTKPVLKYPVKKIPGRLKNPGRLVYDGVFEGITDEYITGPNYVKNNIIIHSRPDAPVLSNAVYLKVEGRYSTGLLAGLVHKNKKISNAVTRGGFEIKANENETFAVSPVVVYEAAGEGLLAKKTAAKTHGEYRISKTISGVTVEIYIDAKWLLAPERKYPVVIDPTVSLTGPEMEHFTLTYDCDIYSAYPADNYGANDYMMVGRHATSDITARALMRFGEVDSIPATATVKYAYLHMYASGVLTDSAPEDRIDIHMVTRSWDEGTGTDATPKTDGASWNNYSGSDAWTTPGGEFEADARSSQKVRGDMFGRWDKFNITPFVEEWKKARRITASY